MRAYVLPADSTEPGRTVEWGAPTELLLLMYREIGCDCVDHGRAMFPDGEITIWVDDTGLTKPDPQYNDRAIALARAGGWDVPALAGTVFITGGATPSGETLGLPEPLLHRIAAAVRAVSEQPGGGGE